MYKINYHYTYRGEQKERVETLEKVLNKLQTAKSADVDTTKLPSASFAKGDKGAYTGLITVELSLRNLNSEEAEKARTLLSQLQQVLLVFCDDIREVIVAVSAYTLPDGSLPTESSAISLFHKKAYIQESLLMKGLTQLELLSGSESMEHLVALAPDSRAWLNPNVRPMLLAQPKEEVDESLLRSIVNTELPGSYDTVAFRHLPGYDEYEMMMLKFQKCLSATNDECYGGSDDVDMDIYLTRLAESCKASDVNEEFAIKRLLTSRVYREKEVLVRGCFDNVYDPESRSRSRSKSRFIPKSQVLVNMVVDYMPRRYKFRRNEMSSSIEYREDGMYIFDWQPVTKEVINTITIELQRVGIPAWDKDVKRYLESNFINRYNPLTDYLYGVSGKWDGKDRIAELAARVPNNNPRWAELFHRWMLSAVSQWLGRNKNYGATMAPMLVGAQGDGKSTFCRMILPPELRGFYTDRLDFQNKKDAERALSAFAIINIDEFDSISKSQTAYLKHIQQKTNVMGRDPYAISFSDHKRYAVFMATTNSPTPLVDPTGSRRYLCVKTTGKIENATPIEYEQVYAQLLTELSHGERAYFNSEEEAYIQEQNMGFQSGDVLQDVFCSLFEKPTLESDGERMSMADIVKEMHRYSKAVPENRSSYVRIGLTVKKLGFTVTDSHGRRCCLIKRKK